MGIGAACEAHSPSLALTSNYIMSEKDYQAIGYLRPVTAFVTTRKETDPPITALMKGFRMYPSDQRSAYLPKVRKRPPKTHDFFVPSNMTAFAHQTHPRERPKTRESEEESLPKPQETAIRSLLTTAQGTRLHRTGSASAIQHNKEVIYNLQPTSAVGIKDIAWQRELRKSPYATHTAGWKIHDEKLLKKTISAGSLRLFLQEGSAVKDGKALVKVCYNYCRSCSGRRSAIQVQLGS